jgi:hypothetical protein
VVVASNGFGEFGGQRVLRGRRFSFALPGATQVRIHLYDVRGRLVERLLDEERPAGAHRIPWNWRNSTSRLASVVYFVQIQAGSWKLTQNSS